MKTTVVFALLVLAVLSKPNLRLKPVSHKQALQPEVPKQQTTLLIIKPDAVQRGLIGRIITRFEEKGLKLVALKFIQLNEQLLRGLYPKLVNAPFFPSLVKNMMSRPVIISAWAGYLAVEKALILRGTQSTASGDYNPGSIRGDFALSLESNSVYTSETYETAQNEIKLFFTPKEIISWKAGYIDEVVV